MTEAIVQNKEICKDALFALATLGLPVHGVEKVNTNYKITIEAPSFIVDRCLDEAGIEEV